MEVKYPNIKVRLTGTDGNAFSIMGKVGLALKRAKVPAGEVEEFYEEAKSGSYDHLLQTACRWVNVS